MPEPLSTELKNVLVLTLRLPSPPVLLNDLMRPLTITTTCVGPTAPMLSGGMEPDSEGQAVGC